MDIDVSIVKLETLPENALLRRYLQGGYTDCYATEVAAEVTHAAYVEAFYTTALFKLERLLLAMFANRPSTDAQAKRLAAGTSDEFAAWQVEARAHGQLLMCDFSGRTRSWLMTESTGSGKTSSTRLYFGSAVVPVVDKTTGQATLGSGFRMLLGFHRVYSRVLLGAARSRVRRLQDADRGSRP